MIYVYTILSLPKTQPTKKMCFNTNMFVYFYVCRYTNEKMKISRGIDNIIFMHILEM